MKSSFTKKLLIFLGASIVPIFAESFIGSAPDYPIFSTCGEQISQAVGAISYKADVSISSNERCVWVIRSQDTNSYTLDVLSLGLLPATDIGITATCVLGSSQFLNHLQINAPGKVVLGDECPILVLTFFSGENVVNSRGFVMFYEAIAGNAHGINPHSKNYVITASEGHVRHPPSVEDSYTINDVSTFVFGPPDNLYNPSRKTLVTYSKDSLEDLTCNDDIRLHRFNPITGWTHPDETSGDDYLCGNIDYMHWTSDDLLMVIFRSSPNSAARGFHITHNAIDV